MKMKYSYNEDELKQIIILKYLFHKKFSNFNEIVHETAISIQTIKNRIIELGIQHARPLTIRHVVDLAHHRLNV